VNSPIVDAVAHLRSGLIVDKNLPVLYAIGSVNRKRIRDYKRTLHYSESELTFSSVCSCGYARCIRYLMSLIDLPGPERILARQVLKETISNLTEITLSSARVAEEPSYRDLGLADAAWIGRTRKRLRGLDR
jgi:hypothetical protein